MALLSFFPLMQYPYSVSSCRPPSLPQMPQRRVEHDVSEAEGTQHRSHDQGQLKAKEQKCQPQDQNKSNPEEQGASQWVGWVGQRKDKETFCEHPVGEMGIKTRDIIREQSHVGGREQQEGDGSGWLECPFGEGMDFLKSDQILKGLRTPG